MRKLKKKGNNFFLLLFILVIIGCKNNKKETVSSRVSVLPYYNEASFTPKWIATKSAILKSFHKIPYFSLTNQDGKNITHKTFEEKIYVANFFFTTCPGICPRMTTNMDIIQQEFIKDTSVLLLSHSVTPTIDSVAQLKKYALDKNISKNWHLVTGDKKEIYNLGRQAYFVEEDLGTPKGIDDFLHTENFVLVDKNKHIRGIYNGLNRNAVQQLIADIKTLQRE